MPSANNSTKKKHPNNFYRLPDSAPIRQHQKAAADGDIDCLVCEAGATATVYSTYYTTVNIALNLSVGNCIQFLRIETVRRMILL